MDKETDSDIYFSSKMYWQNRFQLTERKVYQTRMLKLCPYQYSSIYKEIGKTLLDSGQSQKAIIYLEKAIMIKPDDSRISFNLAKALLEVQKEEECFSCLKKAFSFSPKDWDLHSFLIKTLEQLDRFGEIESFYQQTIDQLPDPKDPPLFYFESAQVLTHYNKYSQALQSFKKAIESGIKQDDNFHRKYAMALHLGGGEFEEAIVQYEKALILNPANKFTSNHKAFLHYCTGRVKKALEELEIITESGFGVYVTYSHFLLIMYHLDQDERVINNYKNLVQPYLRTNTLVLRRLYKDEVKVTERILDKDDIDEETREFNEKKLEALDMILSFIN